MTYLRQPSVGLPGLAPGQILEVAKPIYGPHDYPALRWQRMCRYQTEKQAVKTSRYPTWCDCKEFKTPEKAAGDDWTMAEATCLACYLAVLHLGGKAVHLQSESMKTVLGAGSPLPEPFTESVRALKLDRAASAAARIRCGALLQLAARGIRTDGHAVLEVLPKTGPEPAPDQALVVDVCQAALRGRLCPRLALRTAGRFGADAAARRAVGACAAESLSAAAASGDRVRLCGTLELLAAADALCGDAVAERLPSVLEAVVAPPADAAVIDLVCRAAPGLLATVLRMLADNGQHRLARKVIAPAGKASVAPRRLPTLEDAPEGAAGEQPLALPAGVAVHLVADPRSLAAVRRRCREEAVVAVDAEWLPDRHLRQEGGNGGGRAKWRVQLLQLAWPEEVHLVDLPALDAAAADVEGLLADLLGPEGGPLLLGFGLQGDMQRVADSHPEQACGLGPWRGIELSRLQSSARAGGDGLGRLCERVLGRRLDKEMQCSDWASRPLEMAQLRYAALDAWVLLPLLRALLGRSEVAGGAGTRTVQDLEVGAAAGASLTELRIDHAVVEEPPAACAACWSASEL
ncbi:unnamed protein product [Prorocentrum cordatum]|uniref:3'-5' exonuclease domain-containing protein n=1 Tax=Prorocentrum cordatum TaxID=2364126 RepID=A0ABN9WIM9_9DINO|nr:unnamed protein product [Polarella glacialis]